MYRENARTSGISLKDAWCSSQKSFNPTRFRLYVLQSIMPLPNMLIVKELVPAYSKLCESISIWNNKQQQKLYGIIFNQSKSRFELCHDQNMSFVGSMSCDGIDQTVSATQDRNHKYLLYGKSWVNVNFRGPLISQWICAAWSKPLLPAYCKTGFLLIHKMLNSFPYLCHMCQFVCIYMNAY